jgi:OOP family OmpA-OmpF porin
MFGAFKRFTLMACILLFVAAASAQQSGQTLFAATDEMRANAESVDAALLSPKAYSRGISEYEGARSDYEKGKNPEKVVLALARAREYFQQSISNSEVAASALEATIESRTAAANADSARLATRNWMDGEKYFDTAARALEKNDLEATEKFSSLADEVFRDAELNAFRAQYFSEARRLIAEAEQKKAAKLAPRTLSHAKNLLSQADIALTENRYQVEGPTALAHQASYEARHASYITDLVGQARSGILSTEDIILDWEIPLVKIAGALEIDPDLTTGYSNTTGEILDSLHQLRGLPAELAERDRLIASLEEELREMDTQLGGASAERAALVQRLEHQRRVREQFGLVATMFSPDEAKVLRDGDQLIVRLVGLSFASNSSELNFESTDLMKKVEAAVEIFPRCDLTIEGHTDSQGNPARNLTLSIARAQSVMNFMNKEMRIPDYRMTAAGYGDTRPISNNKTREGRAQNRRIDLIITPNIDDLEF